MPMYDFVCGDCRAKFELVVSRDQQVSCEKCGSAKVQRLFPRPALVGLGGKSQAPPEEAEAAAPAGHHHHHHGAGEGEGEGAPQQSFEFNPENPYSSTNAYYGDDA
jgi:putative FmdB family regulatory protein